MVIVFFICLPVGTGRVVSVQNGNGFYVFKYYSFYCLKINLYYHKFQELLCSWG